MWKLFVAAKSYDSPKQHNFLTSLISCWFQAFVRWGVRGSKGLCNSWLCIFWTMNHKIPIWLTLCLLQICIGISSLFDCIFYSSFRDDICDRLRFFSSYAFWTPRRNFRLSLAIKVSPRRSKRIAREEPELTVEVTSKWALEYTIKKTRDADANLQQTKGQPDRNLVVHGLKDTQSEATQSFASPHSTSDSCLESTTNETGQVSSCLGLSKSFHMECLRYHLQMKSRISRTLTNDVL